MMLTLFTVGVAAKKVSKLKKKNAKNPLSLTLPIEDHILTAHGMDDSLIHILDIGYTQWSLHGQEMITQYALSELGHTERIEAPIDGMPTLEGIVRWYEHCIGIIIHNACQIAFREEMLKDLCARLHVGQK